MKTLGNCLGFCQNLMLLKNRLKIEKLSMMHTQLRHARVRNAFIMSLYLFVFTIAGPNFMSLSHLVLEILQLVYQDLIGNLCNEKIYRNILSNIWELRQESKCNFVTNLSKLWLKKLQSFKFYCLIIFLCQVFRLQWWNT